MLRWLSRAGQGFLLALFWLTGTLGWTQGLDWIASLDTGLKTADQAHRPVLALWTPPATPLSTIDKFNNLWLAFPRWTPALARRVIPVRLLRPAEAQALGLNPNQAGLALTPWDGPPVIFEGVPPLLTLSRSITVASGQPLADPYTISVTQLNGDGIVWSRVGSGPDWTETVQATTRTWVEDGPAGPLLLIHDPENNKRAALPLEGGMSWRRKPSGQWVAWLSLTATCGQSGAKPLH